MLAGQPYHVTQRGVNKGAIFVDDIDRQLFLHLLHSAFLKHQVALHAYVLMGNHVHLLATPSTGVGPEDHPWSSVHGNLQRRHDPMLTEHPAFQALAASKRQRTTLYGQFLRDLDASADLQAIRAHSAAQHPLGSTAYLRMVEQTLGRPAMLRKRGRPRKEGTGGLETT